MHKVERQLQLVALLLDAPGPLTYDQIRERFHAYDQDDDESAKRMFERDKDDLRAMGVPIEMAPVDAWEAAEGYAIPADRYYLPDIDLTPEEASALMVLSATQDEDDAALQALRKLIPRGPGRAPGDGWVSGRRRTRDRGRRSCGHLGGDASRALHRVRVSNIGGVHVPPRGRPVRAGHQVTPLVRRGPRPGARRDSGVPRLPDDFPR